MQSAKKEFRISEFRENCSRRALRGQGGPASPINILCDHVMDAVSALSGLGCKTADPELRFKLCKWIKTMMILLDLS